MQEQIKAENYYPGISYQKLFDAINEVGPNPTTSQMTDIIRIVKIDFIEKDEVKTSGPVLGSLVKVYEALYNPMTWESSYGTLSIHLSKEGAEKAIAFHKMEKIKEWEGLYPAEDDKPYKFGDFEDWAVREVQVLP